MVSAPRTNKGEVGACAPAHREIPQFDNAIVATGNHPAAIRREDDLTHAARMPFIRLNAILTPDVPNFEVGVDRP